MKKLLENSIKKASSEKKEVALALIELLTERFSGHNDNVYDYINWFDPRNWLDEKGYGNEELEKLSDHFKTPLEVAGFDRKCALREWKRFKFYVKSHYNFQTLKTLDVWRNAFLTRRTEFPNLLLLAELILVISGSYSMVECAFSCLTAMITDKRVNLKHDMMEKYLIVKLNDKIWNEKEREEIIDRAVEIFLKKSRKSKVDEVLPPPLKARKIDIVIDDSDEDDNEGSDEDGNEGSDEDYNEGSDQDDNEGSDSHAVDEESDRDDEREDLA